MVKRKSVSLLFCHTTLTLWYPSRAKSWAVYECEELCQERCHPRTGPCKTSFDSIQWTAANTQLIYWTLHQRELLVKTDEGILHV